MLLIVIVSGSFWQFPRDPKWVIGLQNLIETSDNIFGITRKLPETARNCQKLPETAGNYAILYVAHGDWNGDKLLFTQY